MVKSVINKLVRFVKEPEYRFLVLAGHGVYNNLDNKKYLEKMFEAKLGRKLDLDNPQTYNEKLQWIKVYTYDDLYTDLVDKYKVRTYIADWIGNQYLVPLLGVWKSPDEIDFDLLPNKFVLKCNHNSGLGMCICTDKKQLDIKKVKRNLKKGLLQNYYLSGREWPYKKVDPCIIAEKYIGTDEDFPDDYKIFVFNGKIDSIMVCKGRKWGKPIFLFFDTNWNRLYYQKAELEKDIEVERPINLTEMLTLASKLGEKFQHVRVDLYNVNGKIYFGELTFFNQSGFDTDITYNTDLIWGKKIELHKR